MRCLEKLKQQSPLLDKKTIEDIVGSYCPFEWGINYPPNGRCCHSRCADCWNSVEIVED